MPSLQPKEYLEIIKSAELNDSDFKIFVETGTYMGETVDNMLPFFDEIHSIELQPDFYSRAVGKFFRKPQVKLHYGDSSDVLPNLLPELNHPSVFWLDGHFSSGNTAQGKKDCPLLEEISSIYELFLPKALIIIDDHRLFNTNVTEDWSEINEDNILSKGGDRILSNFVVGDRFILRMAAK